MKRLLPSMTGHCTALKSLSIRMPWYEDVWSGEPPVTAPGNLYTDLVDFLQSVKDSLEIFLLDRYESHRGPGYPLPDLECGTSLCPVLLSGPWPRLRLLCMNKGSIIKHAYPDGMLDKVRLALGPNVECLLPKTDSVAPWRRFAEKGNLLARIRAGGI